MLKVKCGSNIFIGEIHSIDFVGEDLLIHFRIKDNSARTFDLTIPSFPVELREMIQRVGISKIRNSVIDFDKGVINFLESDNKVKSK